MDQPINLSDWFCIAQAGKTLDGREIKPEWLESAAKNYDPSYYTALIWCEHEDPYSRQFSLNFGMVEAVKLDDQTGTVRLMARLRANPLLQDLNRQSQKIFTSVELMADFPCEGEHYLYGLAVTDQPASTGLSRLTFSTDNPTGRLFTAPILLSLETPKPTLTKRFLNHFTATKSRAENPTDEETDTMSQEKIDELEAKIAEQNALIEALKAQISAQTVKAAKEDDEDEEKKAQVALSRLNAHNSQLETRISTLEQQFSALARQPVTPTPGIGLSANTDPVFF